MKNIQPLTRCIFGLVLIVSGCLLARYGNRRDLINRDLFAEINSEPGPPDLATIIGGLFVGLPGVAMVLDNVLVWKMYGILICIGLVAVFIASVKYGTIGRAGAVVHRDKNPVWFWINVIIYGVTITSLIGSLLVKNLGVYGK